MKKLSLKNGLKLGLKTLALTIALLGVTKSVDARITGNLPVSTIKDEFPTSYQSYIDSLKEIYPNATFKAVYTGLDWNTILKHECYEINKRISLVPSSYSAEWKKDGKNEYIDGSFVVASKSAVAYVLDPRNSLYEKRIFQFEGLTYNPDITTSVVEKVIASSPMVGAYAKKYKISGQWHDMDMTYSEIIDKVGKELGVSSVYIASRMLQETSGDIVNNGSINGSNATYPGVYNFFNIGATPNSDGTGSVTNGLKYASSQGWTTPYLSIYGGVEEIKSSYIKYGQDTVYFQKFDVNNPYGNAVALAAYQYQTNILAPISESKISYNAYKKLDMLDTSFAFYIPVYENMPEDPTPYPAGDSAKFVEDNTKVYLDDEIDNGTDAFNIRSSANSEIDNIIYTIKETKEGADNRCILTRTKIGDGYDWDYVEFTVGDEIIKGYVWKEYVQIYDYTKVSEVVLDKTSVSLEVGEELTLNATINPTDAKYKDVIWSVSDETIASVDGGKITAKSVGETVVTVTTLDAGKTATCEVNVTEKTYDILLDKEEYSVIIGELVEPVITLKNIESYELKVQDETIACVVDGKIQGLKVGETILEVHGKDTEITKTAKVYVIEKVEEPEEEPKDETEQNPEEVVGYTLDTSLKLNEKIVTGINPQTFVSDLKAKIMLSNLKVEFKDINGKVLLDTDKIGTGTTVTFLRDDGTEYDTLTLVIYGDVDGDGNIFATDYVKIKNYIMSEGSLSEISFIAADVSRDSKIYANDYVIIKNYIMGEGTISQ